MTGGDFSQDAYQALREAYANQLTGQEEQELEGVRVMGQKMSMETLPVDSPWRDKIKAWTYPAGKSSYNDGPQKSPEEVLEIMREAAAERDAIYAKSQEADDEIDEMSDEDLDAYVDSILAEAEDEDEDEEEEDEDEVELEDNGLTDEELDAVFEADEDEEEDDEVEEEEEEEEEEYDPEEIASQIQALREQLDGIEFNTEVSTDDE